MLRRSHWVAGTANDTREQEHAYIVGPDGRQLAGGLYGAAATITVLFAILCRVQTAQTFAALLAVFFVVNIAWWQFMVKKVLWQPLDLSEAHLRATGDHLGLEILANMRAYITGPWQWWRFGAGGIMVLALVLVAYRGVPQPLAQHAMLGDRDRTLGMMLLIYVVGFESWIWIERIKLGVAQRTLRQLGEQYVLELRRPD